MHLLLDSGADITLCGGTNNDSILTAAVCSSNNVLQYSRDPDVISKMSLFSRLQRFDKEQVGDLEWDTLIYDHHAMIVKLLLDHGANVNHRGETMAAP